MAQFKGNPGGYLRKQAIHKICVRVLVVFSCALALAFAVGLAVGSSGWVWIVVAILPLSILIWLHYWGEKKLDRELAPLTKGARGEKAVSKELGGLPDSYYVYDDLDTGKGNLDHVVVGPSGIFAIETKNWGGVVESDGAGELRLNDNPTDKQYVKIFGKRVLWLKDRIRSAARLEQLFVNALMVFPISSLKVNRGETGNVKCLVLDGLCKHIQGERGRNSQKQVAEIATFLDSLVTSHAEDQ